MCLSQAHLFEGNMSKNNKNKKHKERKTMAEAEEKMENTVEPEQKEETQDQPVNEFEVRCAELEAKVLELEAVIAKMKDDDLRRAADTENYKKRLRTDKENAIKYANESLISDLLTPLDNFARALDASSQTEDFEAMKQGVVMVQDQLLSVLKTKWGLEAIDAEGKEFDPNTMEAYSVQEKEGIDKEIVLQELIRGWLLNGKVLRSAKVLVGKPKNN